MTRRREKTGGAEPPAPDYSQRPQRPIRLKPGLADDAPGSRLPDAPPEALLRGAGDGDGSDPARQEALLRPELRSRAEQAAREAGLTFGEWLERRVTQALEAEERPVTDLRAALQRLEARVDALERAGFWERLLGRRPRG